MDEITRLQECIKIAQRNLRVEREPGDHTLHTCPRCKTGSCRTVWCISCWQDSLKINKSELEALLKNEK